MASPLKTVMDAILSIMDALRKIFYWTCTAKIKSIIYMFNNAFNNEIGKPCIMLLDDNMMLEKLDA